MLYDLLVKGGLLVDPEQGIREERDVAVLNGRIHAIEPRIPKGQATRVVEASGMIVTPGLIDIHAHVARNVVRIGVDPEQACLLRGTTTVVDAGSTGELLYSAFERFVIKPSRIRILAFVNFESLGMIEFMPLPPTFTDQKWSEVLLAVDETFEPLFVNVDSTVKLIQEHRDTIVGVKWAHRGSKSMALARKIADKAGCMLMTENRHMPEALKYVKNGDIVTHIYHHYLNPNTTPPRYDGITEDGRIRPEFFDAAKRGVLFDVGHGMGSFVWGVAELALKEGLKPYTISSDLWTGSINGPVYDLPTTMAKFLHLGMTLDEVVRATTSNPAAVVTRSGQIGTLKPGACADIAIFKLQKGRFPLIDCNKEGRMGSRVFIPVHAIRGGEVIN